MRTPYRIACVLVVLFAFLAACGDDDESDTTPTTAFSPTATTAVGGSPTTAATPTTEGAGGIVQNAVDGAPCSPQGARGVTRDGVPVSCTTAGGETRWRPS